MANRFPLWGQAGWASAEVVGETHYAKAIRALFDSALDGGALDARGTDIIVPVQLIPDRSNRHDRNAIGVWSGSSLLGHLPRPEAARYVVVLTALTTRGLLPEVNARITGREWGAADGSPTTFDATIRLDLAEPHLLVPANQPPAQEHRLLPAGSAVQVIGQQQFLDALVPLLRPEGECWAYVTLHEMADHLVEVRLGDARVGDLSPKMSGELLPVLRHIAEQGLVTAARATVRGAAGKCEVMLSISRVQDLPDGWQASPKRPASAAGRGTASVPPSGLATVPATPGSGTLPGIVTGGPAPGGLMSGGPAAGGLVPNWVSGDSLPSWASPPTVVQSQPVSPAAPFAPPAAPPFPPPVDEPAAAFPSTFAASLSSPSSTGQPAGHADTPGRAVPDQSAGRDDVPARGVPDQSAGRAENPVRGASGQAAMRGQNPAWGGPEQSHGENPGWAASGEGHGGWNVPVSPAAPQARPGWSEPETVPPSWVVPGNGGPTWSGGSGALPNLPPAGAHRHTTPVPQVEGPGSLLTAPQARPVSLASLVNPVTPVTPVSPAATVSPAVPVSPGSSVGLDFGIAETTVIPALAAVVKANSGGLAGVSPASADAEASPHPPIPPAPTGIKFVVPDGWPTPPDGWYPPEGWHPDPAWPPAPAGWQWWVPTWD